MHRILLLCLLGLFALVKAQTITTTDAAGNTVAEVITTDANGNPTTSTILTLPPGITTATSVTTAPELTTATATSPTTVAAVPPVQQGPVGQPQDTTFSAGGVTPYTYTTVVNGVTSVLVDQFTPTNPPTLPISVSASGTVLDYSSWLSQYGHPTAGANVAMAVREKRTSVAAVAAGWLTVLGGVLLGAALL
ncbi:hypothetical protein DXG03_001270 [Asterophora parasitica]|uniref:Uncharacterized protein n=1 Tax=Asterophora parasitica TaxID=117018 RepID=A0A9P7KBV8_9AGAR|nr:hypothetical protein DXG03_001270 [Asterophora parasitica]